MSIKLGITGGIGSGKSMVSHLLEIMGIPVYISDIESKRLTITDPRIREELISLLGEEVFRNNELNKPFLANYLFSNTENARKINAIIHPRVKEDFVNWASLHSQAEFIAIESAILIESGFSDVVDNIIMIYAPIELRIKRAAARDNCSPELILERIKSQMDEEEKKKMANYIIYNDEQTPVIPQINSLLTTLRSRNIY